MAIKKSQIEDKSAYAKAPVDKALKPEEEAQSETVENKEIKKRNEKEFNYPNQGLTVRARNKKEADKKLKEITN